MTITESDIIRDEAERGNLQRAIADLETAMAVSNPGTRRMLERSLDGMKFQVSSLDKKIESAKVERAAEAQIQVAAAAKLAAKEARLSAEEKETYRGFLEESYFTKKDFGQLDEFYQHGYDRLSGDGKEEMSKRIHEGIKRGEFKEVDLPNAVQQKEFGHHAAKAKDSTSIQERSSKGDNTATPQETDTKASANKRVDLGAISLNSVKIAEMDSAPNSSSIPDASRAKAAQRSV